jgi:hypothetical protein
MRATTGLSYLTLSLVILGSLVFTVFVTIPQWTALGDARAKLKNAIARREDRREFLANVDLRKQELDQYARDVVALRVALPDRLTQADVFAQLQSIGSSTGATILSVGEPKKIAAPVAQPVSDVSESPESSVVTPALPAPQRTLETYDTSVAVRGTYPQLRVLLQEMEKALLLSDVRSLDVSAGGELGQITGILEGKLTVRTYVQPAPQS